MRIFSDDLEDKELYLLFRLDGTEGIERYIECIAHTGSLDDSLCRSEFGKTTFDIFYHVRIDVYELLVHYYIDDGTKTTLFITYYTFIYYIVEEKERK